MLVVIAGTLLLKLLLFPMFSTLGSLGSLLIVITGIAYSLFTFHIYVRRLQDIGWTMWLILLALTPVTSLILFAICVAVPGQACANQHGSEPDDKRNILSVLLNK